MNHYDISEKDRQAIKKKELDEFEGKRLRGTGYDLMKVRDKGWGRLHDEQTGGKEIILEWHVDYNEGEDYPDYTILTGKYIPKGKLWLTVGKERVLIDKEGLEKLLRWV